MKRSWLVRAIVVLGMIGLQLGFMPLAYAEPNTFNDPNMQIVWERTDKPVEMFVTARSYMWGPNTLPASPSTEPYAEAPGGNRTVQYFDKSRMEVNSPNGDRSNLFFITNGLLVREMVSGNLQLGDNTFQTRAPATEAVAGDPSTVNANSPTYATFKPIASLNNDNPSTNKVGQPVTDSIDKAGTITPITSPDPSVVYSQFDNTLKHNVANVFVDFLNQTGPIFVNGAIQQNQQVINGVFLAGLPITEAFWTKAKVGGVEKDVLVQLFERRVLTYTPSNPAGFKVEMGNVGQHYLRWRYGGGGPTTEERIVFQSNSTGSFQIFSMKTDGTDVKQLTTVGDNFVPRWSRDNQKIAFVSTRAGTADEVFVMNADGSGQTRVTNSTAGSSVGTLDWSADDSRIVFDRDTGGSNDVWSIAVNGTDEKKLTSTALAGNPVVSPDGSKIAFGQKEVPADPTQKAVIQVYTMNADGTNPKRLFFGGLTDDNRPTDWKGGTILYRSQDGEFQVSSTDDAGNVQSLLVENAFAGAFSTDGNRITYSGLVPPGFDIFIKNADGTGTPTRLTNNAPKISNFPDWTN